MSQDHIVTKPAIGAVATATAHDRVFARPALDAVGAAGADQLIVAVARHQIFEPGDLFAQKAGLPCFKIDVVIPVIGRGVELIAAIAAIGRVLTITGRNHIVARTPIGAVVTAAVKDGVVAHSGVACLFALP